MTDRKSWTVMVYLAGDNNLTQECIYSLTEMKQADFGKQVNVFVQFDPKDEHLPTHRFKINNEDNPAGELPGDILSKAPFSPEDESSQAIFPPPNRRTAGIATTETDTGDPRTLFNFISLCVEQSPADHYMVVIAGHGSGTERDFLLRDDSPGGYLTIQELKQVFEWVRDNHTDSNGNQLKIDILGMDVCLMSMAEVCYELRDLVQISVGCESYSPATGWPYRQVLQRLKEFAREPPQVEAGATAAPAAETQEEAERARVGAARAVVEEYVNFYRDYWLGGLSVDQSALDARQTEGLKDIVLALSDALREGLAAEDANESKKGEGQIKTYPFKDALILAHWDAQSYNGEQYVDLVDFCDRLASRCQGKAEFDRARRACWDVKTFVERNLVIASCYSGPKYQYSYGVSIYFPWDEAALSYLELEFAKATRWGDFLKLYTELTRRPPRVVEKVERFSALNTLISDFRKVGGRKVGGRGAENPIRSMRNPPLVWDDANKCIREGGASPLAFYDALLP